MENAVIIPESAEVFVELVHSDSLFQMTTIQNRRFQLVHSLIPSVGNLLFKRSDMSNDACRFTHLIPVSATPVHHS